MIYHETSSGKLHQGEVLDILHTLPDESVNCCVTSPPYWGLRDYGHDNQLGLERAPEEYVARMVEIFREVRRVLKPDGTLWLNLGDSYWGGKGTSSQAWSTENQDRETLQKSYHQITGKGETRPSDGKHDIIKPKDLVGIPWRVAFALQADGWYLRQDLIWHKPNPMPESVRDRCTKSHEYVFLMSKSARYYYDAEGIMEKSMWCETDKRSQIPGGVKSGGKTATGQYATDKVCYRQDGKRNRRSVWTVTTKPFKEAHFATFPRDLIRPMIQAGCPDRVCSKCGRALEKTYKTHKTELSEIYNGSATKEYANANAQDPSETKRRVLESMRTIKTQSGYANCQCNEGFQAGTVLDPFMGSGTTAIEAIYQGKRYIGIDLNPDYCAMAAKRIDAELEQTTIFEEEVVNERND